MNKFLKDRISRLRIALKNDPKGVIAGEICPPNVNASTGVALWDEFLFEADGGRFGCIDIWSVNQISQNQFYTIDMFGGSEEWLIVGQILYEPLAINRRKCEVVLHPQGGAPKNFGEIDYFLSHYLFGDGYLEIIPNAEDEEWWQIIQGRTIL